MVAVDAAVVDSPDVAGQPTSTDADLLVVAETLVPVADDHVDDAQAAAPQAEPADQADQLAPADQAAPAAVVPAPEAGPKRRRRATSRPAGPPTVNA